jgi:hypothetical protein
LDIKVKIKNYCALASAAFITAVFSLNAPAAAPKRATAQEEGTHTTVQREGRVYAFMRKAAAYPVTNVAGCIAGIRFASSLYADLVRQGALQSEEYTKFSIETQLRFAVENGTPVDMNAFWIVFNMLRTNNASWAEVSENNGADYAQQTALWEAITCKFNSGYAGIPKNGPLPKDAVTRIVELMISEQRKESK